MSENGQASAVAAVTVAFVAVLGCIEGAIWTNPRLDTYTAWRASAWFVGIDACLWIWVLSYLLGDSGTPDDDETGDK